MDDWVRPEWGTLETCEIRWFEFDCGEGEAQWRNEKGSCSWRCIGRVLARGCIREYHSVKFN